MLDAAKQQARGAAPDDNTVRRVAGYRNGNVSELRHHSSRHPLSHGDAARPKKNLGDSFMVGLDRVDRISHRVTAPDGSFFELSMPAMQLLVALAERTGRFVGLPELLDEIWHSTPETLADAAAEIAHYFADDERDEPRYVVEAPGLGYRLLQTVRAEALPINTRYSRLFLRELGRRKVFRAAGAYCIGAFVLLQISDATFEALRLPPHAVPMLLIALVVGFPVVVLLAWFLEITSSGIEKDAESGWFRRMGRRWETLALTSLFAVSLVFALLIWRAGNLPLTDYVQRNELEVVATAMAARERRANLERLGAVHFADSELALALGVWQKALNAEPTPYLYYQVGRLHYLLGAYERAIGVLRRGAEEHPGSDVIWGQLGFAYGQTLGSAADETLAAFDRAARLAAKHPEDALIWSRHAAYLACLGRLAEAAALAARLVNVESIDPDVHYWTALALAKIGDEGRANNAIGIALDHGLPHAVLANDPELEPYAYRWPAR